MDEDVLIKHELRKGMELEESMITKLKIVDTIQQAYSKAIHYLGYRMRTEKEMWDYLTKLEVDREHISKIINRLLDQQLLDDTEFANMFVRTRIRTTNKGPTLVKKELEEKGVSSSIANEVVKKYTYEIQYEKALKVAEKRMNRSNKNSFRKQSQQLQAYLMRNGFSQDVVRDVMVQIEGNIDSDEEWEAISHQGERLIRKHEKKLKGYELLNKLKQDLYRQGFSREMIEQFLDKKEEGL